MLMAKAVTDLANRTAGKDAVAMESFAKALMMVCLSQPVPLSLHVLLRGLCFSTVTELLW